MANFNDMRILLEKIDKRYRDYISLKNEINEAMNDKFSFKELSELCGRYRNSNNCYYLDSKTIEYCNNNMGHPIGAGSSRFVYQIDDEKCLKLAVNRKGYAQNKVEVETIKKINSPLFPLVFGVDPNYGWVVTECVLPADSEDFKHCLGKDETFLWRVILDIKQLKRCGGMSEYENEIAEVYGDCELFRNLADYILGFDIPVGDLMRIENWGLAKRNGKEALVVLDVGFNKTVWIQHYGGHPSTPLNDDWGESY